MLNTLKKEFSVRKFSLNLNQGDGIHESWVLPSWALILLRLFISIFCVTIIIISVAHGADSRWLIYLTNWSYLLLTMTMIGLALISIHRVLKNKQDLKGKSRKGAYEMQYIKAPDTEVTVTQIPETELSENESCIVPPTLVCHEKIVWFLWIISANAGLIVTIEYWLLVFRPPTNFMDISVHALNSVFIFIELFIGKLPVRILHWIYVMTFSIIYAVFTVIYWAAGGLNGRGDPFIYDILDYENGKPVSIAAVLLGTIFIVSPLIQFILYGLHRIRIRMDNKNNITNNNVNVLPV
mgnify:FL=1